MSDQPNKELIRNEIKEYLKENLSIEIYGNEEYARCGDGHWYEVKVKIYLDGDLISEDSTRI